MVSSRGVLYRILYDAVLSRLPEPTAIALGQTALRLLPFDRLPAFRLDDSRLAVTLGGARLPNPVILAAMYYDSRILERAMGLGFGAVTTKTITRDARPGHPRPNLVRVRTAAGPGLVNCNGFQNPGLVAFTPTLRGLSRRVPVIASVAGESEDDYVDLARALGASADLVELNISSPNTRLVYAWSTRPKDLRRMLERVRAAVTVPVMIEAGVRVVNYGNTRRVDEPRLSQRSGGLSGPEIFSATLANVQRTRKRFGHALDLVATGGVDAPDKALALFDAGATAVSYFTGFITQGPMLARRILAALAARGGR